MEADQPGLRWLLLFFLRVCMHVCMLYVCVCVSVGTCLWVHLGAQGSCWASSLVAFTLAFEMDLLGQSGTP